MGNDAEAGAFSSPVSCLHWLPHSPADPVFALTNSSRAFYTQFVRDFALPEETRGTALGIL